MVSLRDNQRVGLLSVGLQGSPNSPVPCGRVGGLGLVTSAAGVNPVWVSRVSLLRWQMIKGERGKEREPSYLIFSVHSRSNSLSVLYPSYYLEEQTEIQVAGELERSPARVFQLPWKFYWPLLPRTGILIMREPVGKLVEVCVRP